MTETPELPELTKAEVVTLNPGDTVIVTLAGTPTSDQADAVHQALGRHFPNNLVVVVSESISIAVAASDRTEVQP